MFAGLHGGRSLLFIWLLVWGSFLACVPSPRQPLSLIWISLDTLRADHLQLYGYERDTSPFLGQLAARGLWFEWAISPQNSTLPTHLTQFTGIHPAVHRVMHSLRNPGIRLADSVRTLPEVLAAAGFRTRAWTDGGKMNAHYGFARGFESYDDTPGPFPEKLDRALAMLDSLEADERFFLFVHTYEIHEPYAPPEPYGARFTTPRGARHQRQMDGYDGSIRFVDDQLGRFVGALEHRGLLEHTVLTITADHGESFREYGIPVVGHAGWNLHQNLTRVPWILLHPDERHRGRVSEMVGLVDFANTILGALDLAERLPGHGVDVLASDAPSRRAYLSWTGTIDTPDCAWSLYAEDHHLLQCGEQPAAKRNGLYDVRRDPLERRDLDAPELRASLERLLRRQRFELDAEHRRRGDALRQLDSLPDGVREELRDLGYLDGPTARGDG